MTRDVEEELATRLWPRIFAKIGETALGGRDVPAQTQMRAAEVVQSKLPAKPVPVEIARETAGREKIAAIVEGIVGTLVKCPVCLFLLPASAKACWRCGLRESEVTDDMVQASAEGRNGVWNIGVEDFAMVLANYQQRKALSDQSEGSGNGHTAGAAAEEVTG
jgi:hypothetical protein